MKQDKELQNPIAELKSPDSLIIVKPYAYLSMDKKPEFFCPDPNCPDPQRKLIFKVSSKGTPFFAHLNCPQHEINPTTLLHKLAMKYFERLTEFVIPGFTDEAGVKYPPQTIKIDPTKTVFEYNQLKGIRPDILITTIEGLVIAIEIWVTQESKAEKIEIIRKLNLPAIEIDLSGFYARNIERCKDDISFVQQAIPGLIGNLALKKWLAREPLNNEVAGNLKVEQPSALTKWEKEIKILIAGVLIAFGVWLAGVHRKKTGLIAYGEKFKSPLYNTNNKPVHTAKAFKRVLPTITGTVHKYEDIWEQLSADIIRAIGQYKDHRIFVGDKSFKRVGKRKSYSFNLEFKEGKVVNNIKGSAVARDLARVLQSKKAFTMVSKSEFVKIRLNNLFELHIQTT